MEGVFLPIWVVTLVAFIAGALVSWVAVAIVVIYIANKKQ